MQVVQSNFAIRSHHKDGQLARRRVLRTHREPRFLHGATHCPRLRHRWIRSSEDRVRAPNNGSRRLPQSGWQHNHTYLPNASEANSVQSSYQKASEWLPSEKHEVRMVWAGKASLARERIMVGQDVGMMTAQEMLICVATKCQLFNGIKILEFP